MPYVWFCIINLLIYIHGFPNFDQAGGRNKAKNHSQNSGSNVLLISFDGFRWNYLDLVDTPVLNSFKKLGVSAKYVKNVNPTVTFPNHVTLATGLYSESHGIVSNSMYDPVFNSVFNMSVTDPKWWWRKGVEPIWYTNEKQNGVSGVCYWPGFNIDGYRPRYYADKEGKYGIPYHGAKNVMSYKERVDTVIKWIQEEKPPNFLMLYFGQLDESAHEHGYASPESLREVSRLDNITGYLLDQLSKHKLLDKWNIIITSDHGMTNVSLSKVINITNYINSSECKIIGSGGITFVWAVNNKTQKVYENLKNAHPNMKVYLKDDIPQEYHFQRNRRVSPIVLILDEGWSLSTPEQPFNASKFHPGTHGFLNTYPSMWPLFLARGPAFKKGYRSSPFESVNIYSLMCKILGIQVQPNNGSLSSVKQLLSESYAGSSINPILVGVIVTSIFFALGIFIFGIVVFITHKKMERRGRRRRPWNTKIVMSELEQTSDRLLDYCDDDGDEDGFTEVTHDDCL